jgi:V/A-type H+-transporting ATPase subunit K
MKRIVVIIALALFAATASLSFAQEPAPAAAAPAGAQVSEPAASAAAPATQSPWKYLAAALAVGISCIAGGIAVGQIGAAAMGAMSENPELSGKALPYAGLAEGICLWGFLVALFILLM